MSRQSPIDQLWNTLVKLNHKMTRKMYQDLQIEGKISIDLEPSEVNLLSNRHGKYFDIESDHISMK